MHCSLPRMHWTCTYPQSIFSKPITQVIAATFSPTASQQWLCSSLAWLGPQTGPSRLFNTQTGVQARKLSSERTSNNKHTNLKDKCKFMKEKVLWNTVVTSKLQLLFRLGLAACMNSGLRLQWATSTHWGWVMNIDVGNLTIIVSGNGLSPDWR